MRRISMILLAALLMLTLAAACAEGDAAGAQPESGDVVERYAEAKPGNSGSIGVPGFESIKLTAGSREQQVRLINPATNACLFVISLMLEDGAVIWKGAEIAPGEAFTRIVLNEPLEEGVYTATLRYECFALESRAPLNGAAIKLKLNVTGATD